MFPVIFEFEGGTIYSYGVARLLSYLLAAALLNFTAKKLGLAAGDALKAGVAMVIGTLAGGRLGFVLLNWNEPYVLQQVFRFSGGFINTTAVLGGLLGLVALGLARRRSLGEGFDVVTPAVVGAWAMGNVGCFLAGCCVGAPTSVPWAMRFSAEATPLELRGVPVHPAQLYAAQFELAVLALALLWPRRVPGELFLGAAVALLVMKVGLAALAGRPSFALLTVAYVVLAVVAAALLLVLRRRAGRLTPAVPPPALP